MKNLSPIASLRTALRSNATSPPQIASESLARANRNANHSVYITLHPEWTLTEANRAAQQSPELSRAPLFALPVSLKDCFDLKGFKTTAGTRFYSEKGTIAQEDSAVAKRLRSQGAIITGKTNLHPLAYGITGENPDFGDCLQPANPSLLTGGSTSGGAATVQEGSAVAAIGTDTGGSIRVPAALCGLAGYRASIGLAHDLGLWAGGIHLAQTFDTLGWVFRDLRDGPLLGEGLFGLEVPAVLYSHIGIGFVAGEFLHDCDENVRQAFETCKQILGKSGAELFSFAANHWDDAASIYAPIQASEAAAIHAKVTGGDFSVFPAPINERLAWGASLKRAELELQRARHSEFRSRVESLFASFDFLILPCAPMSRLEAGKDHATTRTRILRYTIPLSLAGTPVVTIPFSGGAGVQLAAPRGEDARLLAYAAALAELLPAQY